MDAIYKLLTLNKNAADSIYERLKRIKGLKCIVREPLPSMQPFKQFESGQFGSIFGMEDKVEVREKGRPETLLIFNIFKEGYGVGDEYDSFTTDSFCLTRNNERLPIGTQIEVDFYGKKLYFKVDDHKNLTPHITEQLFIKNILVPAT